MTNTMHEYVHTHTHTHTHTHGLVNNTKNMTLTRQHFDIVVAQIDQSEFGSVTKFIADEVHAITANVYVYMYVCMAPCRYVYISIYIACIVCFRCVCVHIYKYVHVHALTAHVYVCMYVCMYVMYVCMWVCMLCMYVCMYVCMPPCR